MKRLAAVFSLVVCLAFGVSRAEEIGFIEDFSLATDRTVPLRQLIPGTEDYYYFHSLHYQNTGDQAKVAELLDAWIKRYGYTQRVQEIRYRQALLTYQQTPQQSLSFIRQELNLQFNHQRQELDRKPNFPTRLDQQAIAREAFTQRAMSRYQNLQGFEDSALDWLVSTELNADRLRNLMQRLERPDQPKLPELIVADLNNPNSPGFGQYTIHRQLLLSQLQELLKLRPSLLSDTNFVNIYISKLHPNDDVDWRQNTVAKQAYLDRLWDFVEDLPPAFNSLKAHVLYHRLVFDRSLGVYDKERFITYLKLPRHVVYIEPKYMAEPENRRYAADLNANYEPQTMLAIIGTDEPLVRSYLEHFFIEEDSYQPYAPYVENNYLKRIFAITKIVSGQGDPERWYSMLTPAEYQQLKERVNLDFAYTNDEHFDADEPVSLDMWVKNVDKLIVKVYEINTLNFYRDNQREVSTDIVLEGLVPNAEATYEYAEPALRRVRRHFDFPAMRKAGVYVVDFIGNGKSSRALVRKGQLHFISRTSTAGHVLTILNAANAVVPNAKVYFGGHGYTADAQGNVAIPYSTNPGQQPIILATPEFASLQFLQHDAESYSLTAGIHVDREQLLEREKARVLIRPGLKLNGTPVTLSLLEDLRLTITSSDIDGVSASKEVSDLKISESEDIVHEFQTPQRLSTITFTLQAKVKSLTRNEKIDLSSSATFTLNQIDTTDKIQDLFLTSVEGQYVLALLGKTGEILPDRAIQLQVKHRDFRDVYHTNLQTDETGTVWLGPLHDIAQITATEPSGVSHSWNLREDRHNYYSAIHGVAGSLIEVPYMGTKANPARDELSLLELRGDTFNADRFEALSIDGGLLRIGELPPGDYDLFLKRSNAHIRLRLTDGANLDDWVLGDYRQLETRDSSPLQLDPIQVGEKTITVNVRNANPFTRIHVFATRFVPAYDPFGNLAVVRDVEPARYLLPEQLSSYVEGRNIGDEIRYILDRKYAPKYPGNMLERPELLLNPWAIRQTETSQQQAQVGNDFAPSADPQAMTAKPGQGGRGVDAERTDFSTLDFLALDSAVLLNLAPNEEGQLEIDRDALGPHQHLHIVAVDPQNTVYRTTSLAAGNVPFEDLRLADGLDSDKHFTQQKQTSVIQPGAEFVLPDITSSRFELYDSLRRVHSLYVTLSNNPNLVEFNFVLNWPKLTPDEKRSKYSQYASHELHFFLAQKDPQWFNENIRPYLENKKDKTFLDHYLLGENLSQYLLPWEFERLNIVERILLGRRLEAEAEAMQRHVHERFNLLPPNIDRRNFLFETALKGSSLETDDRLGVMDALKRTKQEQAEFREEAKDADRDLRFGNQAMNRNGADLLGRANAPQPTDPPAPAMPAPAAEKAAAGKRMSEERLGELQNARKEMESGLARRRQAAADDKAERSYFKADEKLRADIQRLYRQVDKTKEWVENNYYHLPIEQQNGDLVTVNAFWNDFAQHPADQPFYSTNMAEASRNFTEMMFALAVLDLPFEAAEHQTEYEKTTMTLEVGSPSIVYHEEIKQAEQMALQTPILVSQNFFRHGDRYTHVDGEQRDKYVTDEFLVHAVYGCQVVVTNPTSTPRKLDLLLQIPNGAIPAMGSKYTRSVHINLQPFNTQTVEYHFYFPAPGEFTHYPVHVAQNEELLAYADPVALNVVAKPSKIDRESWQYISQYGTDAQVMEFLRQNNLQRLELDKIAFRMRDKAFFQQVVSYLADQHAYNQTLWSYAVYHDVPDHVSQFLKHADSYINQVGWYIDSPLLELDPIDRNIYQHMEYKPLVNARRHQLGKRREIVNDRFHQQYHRFLKLLSYYAEPTDEQELEATYYLLLQERVAEAFDFFGRVNTEQLNERLQYDYFTAYLAFYKADPQQARDIAVNYSNHPVDRWREAFLAIVAQADEIEGAGVEVIDDENLAQSQTKLAAADTSFDFEVESQEVRIDYQNVERVRVNYYLMDIEMLFSRNPFVQQYSSQFSYIQPNQSQVVALPKNKTSFAFSLPAELRNQNVLVEISAGGQTKSEAYYSNSLAVQVVENYGQVRVAHEGTKKALAGVYVKVYARMSDGSIKFYKDGYTDLRGRFDFTSLSTNELDNVAKFSLLVLSDEHGAVVREANPPRR